MMANSASASRSQIVTQSRKIRLACTRCHTQKLRCVRASSGENCERCMKLNTLCQFDVRTPRTVLRPLKAHHRSLNDPPPNPSPPVSSQDREGTIETGNEPTWLYFPKGRIEAPSCQETINQTEYPMMPDSALSIHESWLNPIFKEQSGIPGFESLDSQEPLGTFNSQNRAALSRVSSSFASIPPKISTTSSVQELANLNIAIYELAAQLTSISEMAGPHCHRGAQKMESLPIDKLFRLTSKLIQAIESLSRDNHPSTKHRIVPPQMVASPQECLSTEQSLPRANAPSSPLTNIDESTVLLIMSCHSSLMEIYSSFFELMQACWSHFTLPDKVSLVVILPQIQLGCRAPSPKGVPANSMTKSAVEMYMIVVTMLSEQLHKQLADIMGVGEDMSQGSRPVFLPLFEVIIKERTQRLTKEINKTKQLLQIPGAEPT